MALAGVWTNTLVLLSEVGLGAAIIQFRDLTEDELNTCFWMTVSIGGIGYLGLYVAAPAIAIWFESPSLTEVLRVVGLTLPLLAVRVVPDSILRKRLDFDKLSQAEILSAVMTIPVVVYMAWAGAGVWALVAGSLVTSLVQGSAVFCFVRWWPGVRLEMKRLPAILQFSLATMGTRICWSVYQQADTIVLGKVAGNVVVGLYSMAKEFATLPVNRISAVVNQLASPVMAELQGDQEAMRASLLRGVRLVAWATFPLCIGLLLVTRDFVQIVLTDKWVPAVPIIQILCCYAVPRSLDVLLPPVLLAKYRAKFLFGYTLVLLAVMPIAFWVGASFFGATGVAAAWIVVYPLIMARMAREALREVGVSWKTLWLQLRSPLAATFAMALAVSVVHWGIFPWENNFTLGRLIAMSLIGATVYSVVLWEIGRPVCEEMLEVAGWVFRRGHTTSRS